MVRRLGAWPGADREVEYGSEARLLPAWIEKELSPLVTADEWPALLERAPLDLRANVARTSREAMLEAFPGATVTPLSPWGLRLPPTAGSRTARPISTGWSRCRTRAAS